MQNEINYLEIYSHFQVQNIQLPLDFPEDVAEKSHFSEKDDMEKDGGR